MRPQTARPRQHRSPAPEAPGPGPARLGGRLLQRRERGVEAIEVVVERRHLRFGRRRRRAEPGNGDGRAAARIGTGVSAARTASIDAGASGRTRDRRPGRLQAALPAGATGPGSVAAAAGAGISAATGGIGLRRPRARAAGEQFLHPGDHHVRLEGLRQHAVAAGGAGALLVHGLEGPREQQHRDVGQVRRALHERRHFVPVPLGHADIGQDDVRAFGLDALDGLLPVSDGDDLDVLVREGQLDHALNRDAVVSEQELVRHQLSYLGT